MKYDYETLTNFCKEHNILLCEDYLNIKKINANTIIECKCVNKECCLNVKKEFRSFINNPYCNDCSKINAKQKLKTTWLNKYGVEHISKLEHFKNKVKETSLKKYGTECSLQNNIVNEKTKQTCLKKYGTIHCLQSNEIQNKIKINNLEKYGVEHYTQTKEHKEKCKLTSFKSMEQIIIVKQKSLKKNLKILA